MTVKENREQRKRAYEVLNDEMSENTSAHIKKIEWLEEWIVNAMIRFHLEEQKNNN